LTSRLSQRQVVQQDLYELFHDYWQLVTAFNSYAAVLHHSPNIKGVEREATEELTKIGLELEGTLEAIRARMLSLSR
jgi:hypothetical protein